MGRECVAPGWLGCACAVPFLADSELRPVLSLSHVHSDAPSSRCGAGQYALVQLKDAHVGASVDFDDAKKSRMESRAF
jgi:hypothetical protein